MQLDLEAVAAAVPFQPEVVDKTRRDHQIDIPLTVEQEPLVVRLPGVLHDKIVALPVLRPRQVDHDGRVVVLPRGRPVGIGMRVENFDQVGILRPRRQRFGIGQQAAVGRTERQVAPGDVVGRQVMRDERGPVHIADVIAVVSRDPDRLVKPQLDRCPNGLHAGAPERAVNVDAALRVPEVHQVAVLAKTAVDAGVGRQAIETDEPRRQTSDQGIVAGIARRLAVVFQRGQQPGVIADPEVVRISGRVREAGRGEAKLLISALAGAGRAGIRLPGEGVEDAARPFGLPAGYEGNGCHRVRIGGRVLRALIQRHET